MDITSAETDVTKLITVKTIVIVNMCFPPKITDFLFYPEAVIIMVRKGSCTSPPSHFLPLAFFFLALGFF